MHFPLYFSMCTISPQGGSKVKLKTLNQKNRNSEKKKTSNQQNKTTNPLDLTQETLLKKSVEKRK